MSFVHLVLFKVGFRRTEVSGTSKCIRSFSRITRFYSRDSPHQPPPKVEISKKKKFKYSKVSTIRLQFIHPSLVFIGIERKNDTSLNPRWKSYSNSSIRMRGKSGGEGSGTLWKKNVCGYGRTVVVRQKTDVESRNKGFVVE